jgi:hypothetical protein
MNTSADVPKFEISPFSCFNVEFCLSGAMGRGRKIILLSTVYEQLYQIEPATFSFFPFFLFGDKGI